MKTKTKTKRLQLLTTPSGYVRMPAGVGVGGFARRLFATRFRTAPRVKRMSL